MDAQAYLIRHGWSGPGNPLNPNQRPGPHGGLGLTKPILVARKANNHGVGKKTTKDPTNQWWLRGFEDALKGVGDDSYAATSAKTNNALTSELYRNFVRGECLAGTIDEKTKAASEQSMLKVKRKRDADEDAGRRAKKEEKAARKEEKSKRRKLKESEDTSSAAVSSDEGSEKRKESKEERRLRRKEKKEKKEKSHKSDDSTGDDGDKAMKMAKKPKRSTAEDYYPTPMSTESDQTQGDIMELDDVTTPKEKKEKKKSKKDREAGDSDPKKKSKKDKKEKKASA
ncbi:uncharacterized protein N7498_005628 [Penicillium cinerascens]|uniref:G-patch domain-containing protein n=1 Tax=Penicillium cinerascens TaxID=70096 RepID=A0A9W9MNT9_9EURO|nr:uncharacterized protein N7498_005628 [Penicillium cinerascens]KAJ5204749.1 hypothetical protein N7498_005628 [Penicillium cinerascens]